MFRLLLPKHLCTFNVLTLSYDDQKDALAFFTQCWTRWAHLQSKHLRTGTGGSLRVQSQPRQHSKFKAGLDYMVRPCLRKKNNNNHQITFSSGSAKAPLGPKKEKEKGESLHLNLSPIDEMECQCVSLTSGDVKECKSWKATSWGRRKASCIK